MGFEDRRAGPSTLRQEVRLLVPGRIRWEILLLLATAAVVLDLVTKRIVQTSLTLGEARPLLGFLELRYHVNDGAAFGLFSGRQTFILIGVGLALVSVLVYVFIDRRPIAAIAGGLLLGGALGNLVERVAYGRVTDFLRVPYWPTFNVADIFIVAGVALMALTLVLDAMAGEGNVGQENVGERNVGGNLGGNVGEEAGRVDSDREESVGEEVIGRSPGSAGDVEV